MFEYPCRSNDDSKIKGVTGRRHIIVCHATPGNIATCYKIMLLLLLLYCLINLVFVLFFTTVSVSVFRFESGGTLYWCGSYANDSLLLTASSDSVARLWTVETGEVKREYTGHQKALTCLAFRDDIIE